MNSDTQQQKVVFALSFTEAVLVGLTCIVSLTTEGFYGKETMNWQVQAIFQDYFNLFVVVPLLIIAGVMFFKGNRMGMWMWGGTILYLVYTYVIYCFDIHFNSLFIFYCLILGVSFYSFVVFLYWQFIESFFREVAESASIKTIGIYFLVIALLFSFLWLSDDISAIKQNRLPESVEDAGLPTNPVHILDLAIVLPGIVITGILLLKKKSGGLVLAPIFLVFFILMNLTIAGIIFMMKVKEMEANLNVAYVMLGLAALSKIFLIWFSKKS